MNEKQHEIVNLISSINDLNYLYTYDIFEMEKSKFELKLESTINKNQEILSNISQLIKDNVELNFVTVNNQTVMDCAVTKDNVELIEMLINSGVNFKGKLEENEYLRRAAEFGAIKVVKYLIEQKGLNPRMKKNYEFSVLNAASASKYSRNVLAYLIEIMKKSKNEKLPAPKKSYELSEDKILEYLPKIKISESNLKKLNEIIESIFLENYSITISNFYSKIEEQEPELVFACIDLINNVSTIEKKDKIIKKIGNQSYVHHGNLTVSGDLKINSIMVTGNLVVQGNSSNVQGCRLYVGGDFICENLYTEGPIIIGGNLIAKKVEAFYNDYSLEVYQTLTANELIIDNHKVNAKIFNIKK